MDKPRVMVNILNIGTIHAGLETMVIEWMREYNDKYDFSFFLPAARPLTSNRCKICKKFIEGNWDILFMFDEDNIPIRNPFSMLDHNLDVCAGAYPGNFSKGFNFHVFDLDRKQYPEKVLFNFVPSDRREGLQKVDAVATGCMAIKRHVIEKIYKKKWVPFEDTFDEWGILKNSDDMSFCLKCMKLGIPVYVDWNIICDHKKETSLLKCIELIIRAANTGKAEINVANEEDLHGL